MVEEPKNLGELTVALQGIRDQIAMMWKVFTGVAVVGIGCFGFQFSMVASLGERTAANGAVLSRIEASLSDVAEDTGAIRQNIETAEALPRREAPDAGAFSGWTGLQLSRDDLNLEAFSVLYENLPEDSDAAVWVYYPENQ